MLKKILIVLVLLVIVIAGGVYYLWSNLDSLIKAAIERFGSEATQASVRVDKVNLSVSSGEGGVSGLTVGNPAGFSTPRAFSLGDIHVKLDVSTVTSPTVVVKEIVITRPQVTYEQGASGNNLQTLQKNAQDYAAKMTGSSKSEGGGRKLIIEDLYVRDGQIAVSHSLLKGRELSASLPTIHLKDIGKAKGGATVPEVIDEVLGTIGQQASQVAAADLNKALGAAQEAVRGAASGAASTATERVKGLFGK
jgi:uncharacterized protein involved in outer membrane biogenesis